MQPDALTLAVVQDGDRVAVRRAYDLTSEVGRERGQTGGQIVEMKSRETPWRIRSV